ncbi:hypothetical protein EMIT0P258_190058 [Pseudomonas sp. IT-P258]
MGYLGDRALSLRQGTIVDATLIHALSFDQERGPQARPINAPGQEGQSMVLRHESPYRCGCRAGPGG